MTAIKHYESWPLDESKDFIEYYLKNANRIDQNVLCTIIAKNHNRSFNAIKIRLQEIKRILGNDVNYPIVTPNMVEAVEWAISDLGYSKNKILNLI